MASREKRSNYRRPDSAGPRGDSLPQPPASAGPARARVGSWWPLAAAAGLTFVLVVLIVLANLDSPPIPAAP